MPRGMRSGPASWRRISEQVTDPAALDAALDRAAAVLASAEALLIGAGAGMGVDSGLPDFRGPEGFWRAYPPFRGRRLEEMSNPYWFEADPELAWGFFGHRLTLYRETAPHAGFRWLFHTAAMLPGGVFVFTSNVDGQFQKAGFPEDSVHECHGSIHHLQCLEPCTHRLWPAGETRVEVDTSVMRARSALPTCPSCGAVARPNILMFGDAGWISDRADAQAARLARWRDDLRGRRLVVLELGAGLAIPTVRRVCESAGGTLIRINPREPGVPRGGIGLQLGALEALRKLAARLGPPLEERDAG